MIEVNKLSSGEYVALWVPKFPHCDIVIRVVDSTAELAKQGLTRKLLELSQTALEASNIINKEPRKSSCTGQCYCGNTVKRIKTYAKLI